MGIHTKSLLVFTVALATSVPVYADPVKTEAVIVTAKDGQISARTREGDITIAYTEATEIREKKGLSKKAKTAKSLIPGLIIKVEGDQQGEAITAEKIEYNEKDWRMAVATKAGTVDEFNKNAQQIADLRQAIIDGQEYVIQQEAVVYFATGKAIIAPEHKAQLRLLAQQAPTFGNYRISILGFADPRGDAAANERLSLKRAAAVSNFLRQTGSIEPGRVLSPSAMGEGTIAPGETAPTSDAEARRVVARIVTPKGELTK